MGLVNTTIGDMQKKVGFQLRLTKDQHLVLKKAAGLASIHRFLMDLIFNRGLKRPDLLKR